jgi:hypothetical protein
MRVQELIRGSWVPDYPVIPRYTFTSRHLTGIQNCPPACRLEFAPNVVLANGVSNLDASNFNW